MSEGIFHSDGVIFRIGNATRERLQDTFAAICEGKKVEGCFGENLRKSGVDRGGCLDGRERSLELVWRDNDVHRAVLGDLDREV